MSVFLFVPKSSQAPGAPSLTSTSVGHQEAYSNGWQPWLYIGTAWGGLLKPGHQPNQLNHSLWRWDLSTAFCHGDFNPQPRFRTTDLKHLFPLFLSWGLRITPILQLSSLALSNSSPGTWSDSSTSFIIVHPTIHPSLYPALGNK